MQRGICADPELGDSVPSNSAGRDPVPLELTEGSNLNVTVDQSPLINLIFYLMACLLKPVCLSLTEEKPQPINLTS